MTADLFRVVKWYPYFPPLPPAIVGIIIGKIGRKARRRHGILQRLWAECGKGLTAVRLQPYLWCDRVDPHCDIPSVDVSEKDEQP